MMHPKSHRIPLFSWAALAALASLAGGARAADLYVATNGNDAWSGTLPAANAGGTDGPLATLQRAQQAARALAAGNKGQGVTVHVRGGVYLVTQALQFSKEDSGTAAAPVVWRGYANEMPVLIGGRAVSDFTVYKEKILKADLAAAGLKGAYPRQLIFEGQRQHLARYPNFDPQNPYGGGWAYADGKPVPMYSEIPGEDRRTFQYKEQDGRQWERPEEAEVVVFPRYNWWNNIVRIASIDRATRTVKLAGNCSYPIRPTDRYYVRNAFEELDAPGEWYLDKKTSTLYFWPPSPMQGKSVYLPTTRTILEIGPGAHHLTFRGLVFECAEGTAITLKDTADCLIAGNIIRNVGDYHGSGISISGGTNNGAVGNDIGFVGSHGIAISGGDRITLTPASNYADNNYIHHTGVFHKQGVGVHLTGCGNRASHNLIHDGPRMGIMFAGNNLIMEYNHVRHVNLETSDTGAIYTGGRDWIGSRGSVIRHNYFHDILGYGSENGKWVSPHYAWGVYLDDNTGGVDVIGNIVVGCIRGLIHLHNGRDNLVENNVFVSGKLQQIECNGWTPTHRYWVTHLPDMVKGYESVIKTPAWQAMRNMSLHPTQAVLPDGKIMTGNVFQRNIVAYTGGETSKYVSVRNFPFAPHNRFDHNLVWAFGKPIRTGQFAVKGVVGENLVANPSFEEGEAGGKLPAGWKWQQHPEKALAALDGAVQAGGKRSLRIDAVTGKDAKGATQACTIVSSEFPATPGKTFRLRAKMKASQAGVRVSLSGQSYKSKVYFWNKEQGAMLGTEWQEVELVCALPAPGDKAHNPEMKAMAVRIDVRQDATVWVDEVLAYEAIGLDEWQSWQAAAMDTHSVVADPLFQDFEKGDYRLKPESPALKLGFKPIPFEKIGPYQNELRASWPIVEAPGAREKPLVSQH